MVPKRLANDYHAISGLDALMTSGVIPCSTLEVQRHRSQSWSCTPIPINVTFPQNLPDLPCKEISSKVLMSLGFA